MEELRVQAEEHRVDDLDPRVVDLKVAHVRDATRLHVLERAAVVERADGAADLHQLASQEELLFL